MFPTPPTPFNPLLRPSSPSALAESLQHISAQLSSVLSALDSLTPRHCAAPYASFPAPSAPPRSDPAAHTSAGQHPPAWSWAPHGSAAAAPLYSTPITSELRPSQELMSSRWSQIFPGTAALCNTASCCRLRLSIAVSFCGSSRGRNPDHPDCKTSSIVHVVHTHQVTAHRSPQTAESV